jgi:hypothetical protein
MLLGRIALILRQPAVDILVPPLFRIVRAPHISTTLRISALSLLAESEKTHPLALMHYVEDFFEAMVDLLQVESVSTRPGRDPPHVEGSSGETAAPDMDPTSMNSKLPALRRAALHFLALIIRAFTAQLYDGRRPHFRSTVVARARTTVSYLAFTDDDTVVRVMAREVTELLDDLERALVGL